MPAFRFSLQKVLEVRQESELQQAKKLACAQTEADVARRVKADLNAVCEAGIARLAQAHGAGGSVGHLQNLAYVVSRVEEQVGEADAACREADGRVSTQLRSFHEAFLQRKSLDHLKERQLNRWRSEEVLDERKTLDEVALVRHARLGLDGWGVT